ncbi:unnamed protein product [Trifolium pratense]|uniref:Uncharacterized protein n=1 Tax=Trifolium pratense TaxID=57577 RepID=A0ACB0IMR7_TRIPR|nr:unnamed protein product [Trifolium pratense]
MGDEGDNQWQTQKRRNTAGHHKKLDIATSNSYFKDFSDDITTFFFTDFPESFGANAMMKAFQYYGEVKEVVIPAKRDARGRRFGFARFFRVKESRRFETELDNIIIGRNKISVNLSRFHRSDGDRRPGNNNGREEERKQRQNGFNQNKKFGFRSTIDATDEGQHVSKPINGKAGSYAQVVSPGHKDSKGKERESEEGDENLLAITPFIKPNHDHNNLSVSILGSINYLENGVGNSNCLEKEKSPKATRMVEGGNLLDQGDSSAGPQKSTNTDHSITGGVNRNWTQSEGGIQPLISNLPTDRGAKHNLGGVYSDGPRNVYFKLNNIDPVKIKQVKQVDYVAEENSVSRVHPVPAKVRKQLKLAQSLNLRLSNPAQPFTRPCSNQMGDEDSASVKSSSFIAGVTRNPPHRYRNFRNIHVVGSVALMVQKSLIGSALDQP